MTQPSSVPRGGFVGTPQMKAIDEIDAARRVVEAALPIEFEEPQEEDREGGIVVRIRHDGDGYTLRCDVIRTDLGLAFSRAEVSTAAPAGVTTRLLRTAPLAEALNSVRAHEALEEARRRGTRALLGEEPAPGLFTPMSSPDIPETSGRTPITDELLRTVALAYLEETKPGKDRRAIQRLAERFGRPEGTVRTWISRARKQGWLGPGAKGRMGAQAGPKLLLWLGEQMNSDEALTKEFMAEATAMGAEDPARAAAIALRAWRSFSQAEFSNRTGIAPIRMYVAAAVLYERTADEELAARRETGQDEDEAFDQIVAEIRERVAEAEH